MQERTRKTDNGKVSTSFKNYVAHIRLGSYIIPDKFDKEVTEILSRHFAFRQSTFILDLWIHNAIFSEQWYRNTRFYPSSPILSKDGLSIEYANISYHALCGQFTYQLFHMFHLLFHCSSFRTSNVFKVCSMFYVRFQTGIYPLIRLHKIFNF